MVREWMPGTVFARSLGLLTTFGLFSFGFRFHTLFAHSISMAQLVVLITPTTSTPTFVLVAETIIEMRIGAISLQMRSILLIMELR